MASVYAARVLGAEAFEKRVALKVMLPHLSRDPKFVKMFGDEARLAAQIQSPNVVLTIDLGRHDVEGLYQVLELVVGGSLRQLLDASDEPLPTDVALTLLAEVARGLADAHAALGVDGAPLHLVHRDVSPHNVLVGVDGRARLTDFGVARAAATVSATESGELKGKLAYAAPEQLGGEIADARSDVFALGIVVWETLAGRRLFIADNPLALVDAVMRRPIPRLDEVRPELGKPVSDLVASALLRDRDERRLTTSELAGRLAELAREAGGPASPERIGAVVRERCGAPLVELEQRLRSVEVPDAGRTAPPSTPPPPPRTSPNRRLAGLGALVLVVGAVAIAIASRALWSPAPAEPDARGVGPARIEPAAAAGPPPSAAMPPRDPPTSAVELAPEAAAVEPIAAPSAPRHGRPRPPGAVADEPPPVPTTPEPTVAPDPPVAETDGLLGVEDFDRDDSR